MQRKPGVNTFTGMTALKPDYKLCNFTTSIKTPENFAQGSFSTESLK